MRVQDVPRRRGRERLPAADDERLSFDVEVLYAAQRRGYRIVEVPINWYYKDNTRIHPIRDSINMFAEVFKIRRNGLRGMYNRSDHDA